MTHAICMPWYCCRECFSFLNTIQGTSLRVPYPDRKWLSFWCTRFHLCFSNRFMLSSHLCLLILCYCLVFWILCFDCSTCLIAWYFYIFLNFNNELNGFFFCKSQVTQHRWFITQQLIGWELYLCFYRDARTVDWFCAGIFLVVLGPLCGRILENHDVVALVQQRINVLFGAKLSAFW